MRINWFATTAVALMFGTGAVIAQSQTDQKREETPRAQQTPSKNEAERGDRQQGRNAQSDQKGAKGPHGQAGTAGEHKQTQDQQPGGAKQPRQQSQDRDDRGHRPASAQGQDRPGASPSQQSQDQKNRPDTKQAEPRQQGQKQQGQKQQDQARDANQPSDQKQQTGQQQPTQPSTTATQQGPRPGEAKTGPTRDQTTTEQSRTGTATSSNIDERQRTEVVNRLRRDRSALSTNINVNVNVGVRLPSRARVRPLPQDIVRIMPRYRGYQYTVVQDEVVIVEPRTRKVVEVIREPGSSTSVADISRSGGTRISISTEQREMLKQSARRMTTAPTSGGSSSLSDTSCLQLQAMPDEVARSNPELSSYRMLAVGEQIVLVDPRETKIVEVIN
jgi:hypothetical protein